MFSAFIFSGRFPIELMLNDFYDDFPEKKEFCKTSRKGSVDF